MPLFISTYENKVDSKARVSVPASFRSELRPEERGIIAIPSLTHPAIDCFERDHLVRLNKERLDRTLEEGRFEQSLMGDPQPSRIDTVMSLAQDLAFDGQGRITLPERFASHARISSSAVFVGRGSSFQIWSPENNSEREERERIAYLESSAGQPS